MACNAIDVGGYTSSMVRMCAAWAVRYNQVYVGVTACKNASYTVLLSATTVEQHRELWVPKRVPEASTLGEEGTYLPLVSPLIPHS